MSQQSVRAKLRSSPEALNYLISHVFLPPKLPQEDDFDPECEAILLDLVLEVLLDLKNCTENQQADVLDQIIAIVTTLINVLDANDGKLSINEEQLRSALQALPKQGGCIPLHICAQNAGVIVSKVGESIHVEAFELSPSNEAVLTTKGRLRRSFPGTAFALDVNVFEQTGFQETMAYTLAKMSRQPAVDTLPQVRKAGQMHDEDRDTTHPKIVTELFMGGFIRAVGQPLKVVTLCKNTREEVMWLDSRQPWRRSPMWLLVRVTLQLAFSRCALPPDCPSYKIFMILLMSQILHSSQQTSVPSELLYAMNCKLSRRLLKLDCPLDGPWFTNVIKVMHDTQKIINAKWLNIRNCNKVRYDFSRLEHLDWKDNRLMYLPALNEYIQSLSSRHNGNVTRKFQPTIDVVKYSVGKLPCCSTDWSGDTKVYNLRALEAWVSSNLHSWLQVHGRNSDTCEKLGHLIETYHSTAVSVYSGNPEAISIMILTILELWVACDKSAIEIHALLRDYDPGIPRKHLQCLLLPFEFQMDRLSRIEDYLDRRQDRARYPPSAIYEAFGDPTSFSVRYFLRSSELQQLLATIEHKANQSQMKKREELLQMKEKYCSLMKLYDDGVCEYSDIVGKGKKKALREQQHKSDCRRCRFRSEARSLYIDIFEWPLPSSKLKAQSTVFELKVPHVFGSWRDTSTFLLLDVLKNEYAPLETSSSPYTLQKYSSLQPYLDDWTSKRRISLLSQTKPHAVTHRRQRAIPDLTDANVCLNNGLSFRYYDTKAYNFVRALDSSDNITSFCTYELPLRSRPLQCFLFRPSAALNGPTPNSVIASVSDCPDHMSLDEYRALAMIPLDFRIQWQNILVQLHSPSIDLKKIETALVILQTIFQAGPSNGNCLRKGHVILSDENFVCALLDGLQNSLLRFKANWESAQAISTLVAIAARVLSLSKIDWVQSDCLSYLRHIRMVTLDWVNILRNKAQEAIEDVHRAECKFKAIEIALICADTFNIDVEYQEQQLSSSKDASIYIQCAILIQQGKRIVEEASDRMVSILLLRWKWLSYRIYPILARKILGGALLLDDAIKESWSAYQPGGIWSAFSQRFDHWLVSDTAAHHPSDRLSVQFNLLTGELLVNCLPLARLPSDYESHPTYRLLFGESSLEVMPSGIAGMEFSAKKEYAGYVVHFGMKPVLGAELSSAEPVSPARDLLVRVSKDERVWELLPSRFLHGKVPAAFVDEYVHWYDVNNRTIILLPVIDPWTPLKETWTLTKAGVFSRWHLQKGCQSLIPSNSQSALTMFDMFNFIADRSRIHITFQPKSSLVEIELPQLQLGFYFKAGASRIESKQFRGLFIDNDQSLGTLIGLENKLILKEQKSNARLVILPDAPVSYVKSDDHIRVTIEKENATLYHAYHINGRLRKLVDNGSLRSMLFLSYLHAITSFCLPDVLTHRTGTEQALSILQSAAVRSSSDLCQSDLDLLYQIACLSPRRGYYPKHARVMQTVRWSEHLDFLAQHDGFCSSVRRLFEQTERARFFHPHSSINIPNLQNREADLEQRDRIRSSTFRVSGYGAEDHTVELDISYLARDRNLDSAQSSDAFVLASLILRGRSNLHMEVSLDLQVMIWDFLSRDTEVLSSDHVLPSIGLKYDATWLLDWSMLLSQHWIGLYQTLSQASSHYDKFRLMTWFSTLGFAKDSEMIILQTLAAGFLMPGLAHISVPLGKSFWPIEGRELNPDNLRDLIGRTFTDVDACPEGKLKRHADESKGSFKKRKRNQLQERRDQLLDKLLNSLTAQWPCEMPQLHVSQEFELYLDVQEATTLITQKFRTWLDNDLFYDFLRGIVDDLHRRGIDPVVVEVIDVPIENWSNQRKRGFISVDDIFNDRAPSLCYDASGALSKLLSTSKENSRTVSHLNATIQLLEAQANSTFERVYAKNLQDSLGALQNRLQDDAVLSEDVDILGVLNDHQRESQEHVDWNYKTIVSSITAFSQDQQISSLPVMSSTKAVVAGIVSQRPRVSPIFFLQQLSHRQWTKLNDDWKRCIVHYALSLSQLQRAERLVRVASNNADLIQELRNLGHTNWNPLENPDSLLLEVESGIMIREIQRQIAEKMINPRCVANATMQLDMGEGKSSVIVPIVATALADGTRLVRVIVAKPQSKQMFQMLVSKLGGLLDRPVYQMPFSRSLKPTKEHINAIDEICRECMTDGGILLVQPEHLLSFQLMGIESLLSGNEAIGCSLLEIQRFFHSKSRDIVDESDENFNVKFELIYTMGLQQPLEHSPDRWICIQTVLDLVRTFATAVREEFPTSLDVNVGVPGSFPRIRFLGLNAQQRILKDIARHICENGMQGFPICRQPKDVRQAVYKYVSCRMPAEDKIAFVESSKGFWTDTTKQTLLLLRGLLAEGVLAFALGSKRWRVDYGLDTSRQPPTRLAVPYRAKDDPASRSEFSHPDVVIVLTCLSHYYGGMEDDDLFLAFNHLVLSDQANIEYQAWVKDAPSLPRAFRQLDGINLKDRSQCIEQVFPSLRYAKQVIDYFLKYLIFPKEMRVFPHKLSGSGWDIGQVKMEKTTGFSGTNDSRQTLPLSVQQLDLEEQNHTNALVLEKLLRSENSVMLMTPQANGARSDAKMLLDVVTGLEPAVRVIIDVGAQILEYSNVEVASEWLKLTPDNEQNQAVVFFNDNDEICVIDRQGRIESLQISSFVERLDLCFVFLDEAHTRGTDLKLPRDYRAAVTLGPGITKDKLVQACMRMRKLGQGQSIVFCVPEEVQTKILLHTSKSHDQIIDISKILVWAMFETYSNCRKNIPLWAVQGRRFFDQRKIWTAASANSDGVMSERQAKAFLENECQTLEQRYRPSPKIPSTLNDQAVSDRNISLILKRCQEFEGLEMDSAPLQEEQERELAPEIEQERQIERPVRVEPADHYLHRDLLDFVHTGRLKPGSRAYRPAFETLIDTSAAAHLDVMQFPQDLLATVDFARTVEGADFPQISDSYQRPVQWILTSTRKESVENYLVEHMMIISPFEAQELLTETKNSKYVTLHVYAARSSREYRSLDQLDLYTVPERPGEFSVPRKLVVLLNLFAGQLYIGSFDEYVEICELLGLAWERTGSDCRVSADGFIVSQHSGGTSFKSTFSTSPVSFMKVLMTRIRRDCQSIDKTHMGAILDARLLRPSDFEQSSVVKLRTQDQLSFKE